MSCTKTIRGWRALLAVLALLILAGCGTRVSATAPVNDRERLRNGDFEAGLDGWTPSLAPADKPYVQVFAPVVTHEAAHAGQHGVRCATPTGTASICALEQAISPTISFTLEFWARPAWGSSRVGVHGDGSPGYVTVSRVVFLDAGQPSAAIVFTAWDVSYVLRTPLPPGAWQHVVVTVDGVAGRQTLRLNDAPPIALASHSHIPGNMLVFGDRQHRIDSYTIGGTTARVTDGLNGSYDYDGLSLRAD